jgi:pyridoxamine 5'-phosphate oxidase
MELGNLRREYLLGGLNRENLLADPIKQFELWLQQAIDLEIHDPTAMVIATVAEDGQPSQRIVLLKHLDDKGFVFFTNFGSRKAKEIAENSKVSLHFPWNDIDRQVKLQGKAQKISTKESLKYFLSRPRESQLAAWASEQSMPLTSKQVLLTQVAHMKEKFSKGEVPLPDFWGGIRVTPNLIEFWQGGENRLHDRFEYSLQEDASWKIQRLAP